MNRPNLIVSPEKPQLFLTGTMVTTEPAANILRRHDLVACHLLNRHRCGDFGEITLDQQYRNMRAITLSGPVRSTYALASGHMCHVYTNGARTMTTLYLPGEQPEGEYGTEQRFPLGRLASTPGAMEAINEADDNLFTFVYRHAHGDWGCVCDSDARANERAIKEDARLLSSYKLTNSEQEVWVITEADRSVTTVLLPEEY